MVNKIFSIFLLTAFTLCGCNTSTSNTSTDGIVDITIDVDNVKEQIDLSSLIEDEMEAIKLETNDSCLISKIQQIAYVDNRIYISDGISQTIYAFDKAGKFIRQIGKKGSGPGEYVHLGSFQVLGEHVYMMDDSTCKLYDYNLQTGLCKPMEIDDDLYFENFQFIDYTLFLISNNEYAAKGAYNLFQLNQNKGDVVCKLPFHKEILDTHSTWGLLNQVGRYEDTLLTIFANNDTIYEVSQRDAFPKYVVHFTKRSLPEDLRKEDGATILTTAMDKNYIDGISSITNMENHFIAQYGDNVMCTIFYNKQEKSYQLANWLVLGKFGDMYMTYYTFTDNNELVVADTGYSFLSSWKERYSNRSFAHNKDKATLETIYEQTEEEDNPIICIFKLRKEQ